MVSDLLCSLEEGTVWRCGRVSIGLAAESLFLGRRAEGRDCKVSMGGKAVKAANWFMRSVI